MQSFGYDWLDRLTSAATNAAGVGQYSHTYAYNAIGNITSYNGAAYTYGTKPHAVTAAFGNSYGYDAVGNQTSRTVGGVAYTQTFDYDNRLTGVAGGSVSATFLYDAAGNRVKGTVVGVTTVYIAGLYEWQNGAVTKYYEGGAIRRTGYANDNGVFYVVSDQLRSTSVLVNQNGTVKDRNYYYPYGGNRGGSAFSGVTTKRFTGQYHEQGLPGGEGLSYYNARWYDSQVGMFISADTLVPSPLAPQTFNRYAYVGGNPLRYTDPTGHMAREDDGGGCVNCQTTQTSTYTGSVGVWKPAAQKTWTWPPPATFTAPKARVYYLNQIGNISGQRIYPNANPNDEQGYTMYRLAQVVGENNVQSIPVFVGSKSSTRWQMFGEMFGVYDKWTRVTVSAITEDVRARPLVPGQKLVVVGSSGGGTVAVEALRPLEKAGIHVDQLILRGSPVQELVLRNVDRVDYITSNLDYYLSLDINPFDRVEVQMHFVDYWGHVPPNAQVKQQIGDLIADLAANDK